MKKFALLFAVIMAILLCLFVSCQKSSDENASSTDITTDTPTTSDPNATEAPIHTHTFGEWQVTTPATCTAEGVQTRSCECGETETMPVAVIAHTEAIDEAVDATCTSAGKTEGKHCSVCGTTLIAQNDIPMTQHTEIIDAAVDATCTKTGLTEGKHCSVCETVLVKQTETPKTPHVYTDKYDATCNTPGCGFERDPACAHTTTEVITGKPATCTQSGLTDGLKCANSKCGEILTKQTVIPVKPHTEVTDAAVESTCTKAGLSEGKHCSVCGTVTLPQVPTALKPHTEVIDKAVPATYEETGLTEGKHCSACSTVLVAQQIVPKLETVYHKVTYFDEKLSGYPKYETYKEHIGVNTMPVLSLDGYKFEGWYTKYEGGEKVPFIPAGSTTDYVLYARWSLIEYDIRYVNAPVNDNPDTYTVEKKLVLDEPEWSGMKFVCWKDQNGNTVTEIPQGTTGEITLTAHWTTYRNYINSSNNTLLECVYDEENERYYFFYELGIIENVILDNILTTYNKTTNTNHTMQLIKTVSIEENHAKTIAETIGRAVTKSDSWKNTTTDSIMAETGFSMDVSLGLDFGLKDKWNASLETKYGVDFTTGMEYTFTDETGGGTDNTTSLTSNLAYETNLGTTVGNETHFTIEIPGEMPNGYYAYVHAGNVRVFAVVTYDLKNEEYLLNTYSVMDNMHDMVMYYATVEEMNANTSKALEFEIPEESIDAAIKSSYYIRYDANNGTGSMPVSLHEVGVNSNLSKNQFVRNGYTFSGWELRTDGGVKEFGPEATIKDIAACGDTITLYARWTANAYTVTFNANSGSVSPSSKTVTFDGTYGSLPTPQRTGYTFSGWTLDGNKVTSSTKVTNAGNHTLVATWTANTYTVNYNGNGNTGGSTAASKHTYDTSKNLTSNGFTRTGYSFAGWNTKADGTGTAYTNSQSIKNLVAQANGSITLYAQWTTHKYTVVYNANGGTGSTANSAHTYDVSTNLTANGYSRHGWIFLGWSTNPNATSATYGDKESVKNLSVTNGGTVTLYAVWQIKTVVTYVEDYIDVPNLGEFGCEASLSSLLDIQALANAGYKYRVTISYNLKVDGDHLYANTRLNMAGKDIFNKEVYYGKNATGSPTYTINDRPASEISSNSKFQLWFDAKGVSGFDLLNHFSVSNVVIKFEFYK